MISYITTKVENLELEGFEATLNGSELSFTKGIFKGDDKIINFEAFAFDIEPSTEFKVIYDIYLLENGSVHIDRTEDQMAFYEGTEKLLLTLASFTVEPNEVEHNVKIYKVVNENEEN